METGSVGDGVHAHIEAIVENLTIGLVEYDRSYAIIRINRAAEEMLGVSRAEVAGVRIEPKLLNERAGWKSLVEVSYPALARSARRIDRNTSGIGADAVEVSITHPLERDLEVVMLPLPDASENAGGFVKMLRDITREKAIARSKSEFISIAAHQLRTPLSAVKWALRLVMDGDTGELNPAQEKMLARGYATNEKMIHLVNDLLNVSRIEDGRFGYRFERGAIEDIISSSIAGFSMNAAEHGVSVEYAPPPERIPPFAFDPDKVALAIQNLVDNAIKYTPPGGRVSVALAREDSYVKVTISDTGVGVPRDQIARLFGKFFRASNVIHMQTTGSGLGLFIVKNIVARHGGEIGVKSEENKGSTFWLTLPMDENLIPLRDDQAAY